MSTASVVVPSNTRLLPFRQTTAFRKVPRNLHPKLTENPGQEEPIVPQQCDLMRRHFLYSTPADASGT